MKTLAHQSLPHRWQRRVERPRLGFLGVGWIGRHRMEATFQSGCAEVVAIADARRELAEAAAESLHQAGLGQEPACRPPGPKIVSSLDELLDQDLDGIVIATPSALHAEQSIKALDHGVPVFCQKPLARNAQETRAVIEAARSNDCLLGVDLSYRFLDGVQKIRELVRHEDLGKVFAVELAFHNAYGPDKGWFYDRTLSGGGCVIDLGIHLVDLALWTLDFPQVTGVNSSLFAQGEPLRNRKVVEDYATARFDLDCGTSVQLSCSWRLPVGCDAIIEASFYGTKGGAVLKNVNGSFYDFTTERCVGTKRQILSRPPENWGGRAIVNWVRQLSTSKHFDNEIGHMIDVAETLDRIYAREN